MDRAVGTAGEGPVKVEVALVTETVVEVFECHSGDGTEQC